MTDEATYKIEIHRRDGTTPVVGTFSNLEKAKETAADFLLDAGVCRVRVLDHNGEEKYSDTSKEEEA